MKTKILLAAVVTLSLSGLALSDSLIPESRDNSTEKMTKEINHDLALIWQQAQTKFKATGNETDQLRLQQVKLHLETAESYKASLVFTVAKRELNYANSLVQMPQKELAIGHL